MVIRREHSVGSCVAGILLVASAAAWASEAAPVDPFLGDWMGEACVAQVIPRGAGEYQVNLLPVFDQRCPPLAILQAKADQGKLKFNQEGLSGEAVGDTMRISGSRNGRPFQAELKPTARLSPRLGTSPPAGAIVLFDGRGFDEWEIVARGKQTSEKNEWQIDGGIARAFGHSLITKRAFQDCQLHVEFRLPLMAEATGQKRSNSGINFEDYSWHEIQILDSYGLPGYWNECGALYNIAAPKVNMCAPPLQWQTYDITYHAPRYGADGQRKRPGRITVDHNGTIVHKNEELPDTPQGEQLRRREPSSRTIGRIQIHYHGNPIEFRNIWVKELKDGNKKKRRE